MMKLCSDVLKALEGKTLVTAESLTGGGIGGALTSVPGASKVFKGGVISYTDEVKREVLSVPAADLTTFGAVSAPVAAAMARGVRELLKADVAVSVTGLAGPDGDDFGHEVGTVFIALATEGETFVREIHLGERRTRSFIRRMAGNYAFDMMRRYMSGKPVLF